jgi:hypothetical protein
LLLLPPLPPALALLLLRSPLPLLLVPFPRLLLRLQPLLLLLLSSLPRLAYKSGEEGGDIPGHASECLW